MHEMIYCGNKLRKFRLQNNFRVIYPPSPLFPSSSPYNILREAIENPIRTPPLEKILKPKSHVSIAFDDISLPLPPLKNDFRKIALNIILEKIKKAGIPDENITFIAATGLHRKMRKREMEKILGEDVIKRKFHPSQIISHDAEDKSNLVYLGKTDDGCAVEVSRFAIETDLLIYIGITWTPMNGGWKSFSVGLSSYESIKSHHNPEVLLESNPFDPDILFHEIISSIGRKISEKTRIFKIEMVLNNRIWKAPLSLFDFNKKGALKVSMKFPNFILRKISSDYQLLSAFSGQVDGVHKLALNEFENQFVFVESQSDVLILGIPNFSPYSVSSFLNPILFANLGLGYFFNLSFPPLVKKGGVLILNYPLRDIFDEFHHPSYIDFFKILPDLNSISEMKDAERDFAGKEKYLKMYRESYAFHPVHPFYAWYFTLRAKRYLKKVIVARVKEKEVAERLGMEAAKDIKEAIEKSKEMLGRDIDFAYQAIPPIFFVKVGKTE